MSREEEIRDRSNLRLSVDRSDVDYLLDRCERLTDELDRYGKALALIAGETGYPVVHVLCDTGERPCIARSALNTESTS